MDPLSRSAEAPAPARGETTAASHGADLRDASALFAELLGKDRKDVRARQADGERRNLSEQGAGLADAEPWPDAAASGDAALVGGDAALAPRDRHEGADGGSLLGPPLQPEGGGAGFLGPPTPSFGGAGFLGPPTPSFGGGGRLLGPPVQPVDSTLDGPRFLGPAVRPPEGGDPAFGAGKLFGPPLPADGREPALDGGRLLGPPAGAPAEGDGGNAGDSSEQPLPTPGELMLQAFGRPREVRAVESAETANFDRVGNIDAIQQLGDQIAERILVSASEAGGSKELLIQLRDAALPGTEVRIVRTGERMQVTFTTDHAASFNLLADRQADLQARLGEAVTVQLAFDPDGLVSRARLDRPQATEAGQQTGDGRERDSEGRPRDRRRRDQDADGRS